ncbi:MAG: ABC transporter permease, partial [Rhodospirillales bacterium]|nr:ABC transporter permease [Rhodospirillales bacterium]
MSRFLLQRFWQALLVLALMSFAVYGLMGLMPGDPIDLMISSNPDVTSEDAARLRALYGLDKPITERYGNWLAAAVTGDFGYSRVHSRPVLEVLLPALWNTLRLLGLALAVSIAISIPLGVLAAARPYSRIDYAVNLLAFAGISVPVFWLGLLLIIIFSVMLGILPAGGTASIGETGFWDQLRHLILPATTLIIASVGGHTRYVRSAMMEVLRADYIRTARAKGLGWRRVLLKHALRNALIPVTTIIALDLGFLFS